MARIVYISKYPPMEGGIASKTYWLVKNLAKRGHRIYVVTDHEGEEKAYTTTLTTPIPNHSNVTVYRPDQEVPWHLPYDEHRALALLNKAIEVVEREKPDMIEAGYLVPYGLIAYLVSKITGLPYVLQHGGSDVRKFVEGGLWPDLINRAISNARHVVTDNCHRVEIERKSTSTNMVTPYIPDIKIFYPTPRKPRQRPVLALIGKVNYHWKHKGWHRVIKIWSKMGEGFDFLVVGQGNGLEKFKKYTKEHLGDRVSWKPFYPPWEMPSLLNSVDLLFHFETDLPFPVFSNLVVEALFCGTAVISDKKDFLDRYSSYGLNASKWGQLVLRVEVDNPNKAAERIKDFTTGYTGHPDIRDPDDFEKYVAHHERLIILK